MRTAIRTKRPRGQTTQTNSYAAPIGGWNDRDALANMDNRDAVQLLNWFPTTTDCVLRGGNSAHSTGITGLVETLAVYNKMDGTSKMYAVTDTDAYDASSAGAASAQSATVTDGKFQYINYGDGTSNWLIMVNGVDKPLYFDGSSWVSVDGVSTPAITGITTTDIIGVNEYKGRVFFIQKNSLSFWYAAAGAAAGGVTEFDLSSYASRGGYLMWMATWSFDSGDGPDDAAVFMTSEGQVIVYRGTDPSTAANWVLTGVYQIGKPLGRRSYFKYGGDLLAITQNGVFPLSKALQSTTIDNTTAVTYKIERAFNDAAGSYGTNFGWDITLLPLKSALIFNIPVTEGGIHKQYVMNTITESWCEYDSWNGECFAEFNDELYFGGSTIVQKAWTGTSDAGANIVAVGKTAFNYFGEISQEKRFNLFRPLLRVNGDFAFLVGMDVDFSDDPILGTANFSPTNASLWDASDWDDGSWGQGLAAVKKWVSPTKNVGYCASAGIKVETNSLEVHWIASDYVFERGGVL